jgi:hypothetical protein
MEANPGIIDHMLGTEVRALKNAKNILYTDKIFDNIRILSWIKYLIIEKNSRLPREDNQEED